MLLNEAAAAPAQLALDRFAFFQRSESKLVAGVYRSIRANQASTISIRDKFKVLLATSMYFLCACGLNIVVCVIPLPDPGAAVRPWPSNVPFLVAYPTIWSSAYATAAFGAMYHLLPNHQADLWLSSKVAVPLTPFACTAYFLALWVSSGEFPPKHAPVHLVLVTVIFVMLVILAISFASRNGLLALIVSCTFFSMLLGWAMAIAYVYFFQAASPLVQGFLLIGLRVWKAAISFMVHGYYRTKFRLDLSTCAYISSSVAWFWCMYSDIVFSSIKSPLVVALAYIFDVGHVVFLAIRLHPGFVRLRAAMMERLSSIVKKKGGPTAAEESTITDVPMRGPTAGAALPTSEGTLRRAESDGTDDDEGEHGFQAIVLFMNQAGEIFIGTVLIITLVVLRVLDTPAYIVQNLPADDYYRLLQYNGALVLGESLVSILVYAILRRTLGGFDLLVPAFRLLFPTGRRERGKSLIILCGATLSLLPLPLLLTASWGSAFRLLQQSES